MRHGLKILIAALACVLTMTTAYVEADDIGLRVSGPTGARLAYFGDSEGKVKLGEWSSQEVTAMNLQIQAAKGDFVQVTADGKPVWLDRERIRVARKGVDCVPVTVATAGAAQPVAGARGASKQGACQ
ncbi:MAG: hypothetical protein H7327_00940 [Herminiimonas sp.]|nr:hypothetical protein [Herminiimonas sp.]